MKLFLRNQLGFGEFQVQLEWISREDRPFLTQLTMDWTGLIGVQSTTASTSLCAQRSALKPQASGVGPACVGLWFALMWMGLASAGTLGGDFINCRNK